MRNSGLFKSIAVAVLFMATMSFAQYPGPGYPPSGGSGSAVIYPFTHTNGDNEFSQIINGSDNFIATNTDGDSTTTVSHESQNFEATSDDGSGNATGISTDSNSSSLVATSPSSSSYVTVGGGGNPIIESHAESTVSTHQRSHVLQQDTLYRVQIGDNTSFPASELTIAGYITAFSGNALGAVGISLTPGITASAFSAGLYYTDGGPNSVTIEAGSTGARDTTIGSKPTCDASARGRRWYVEGGAGVADTYEACTKDAADVYAWRTLLP